MIRKNVISTYVKCLTFCLSFLMISFSSSDNRSQYSIPWNAYSVTAGDIDQDGDNDIVVGHNYSSQTQWSGVSILLNDGSGLFELYDSVFLYGWQPDILMQNIDTVSNYEIIAKYEDAQNENEYIAIISDFNLSDISYFSLDTYKGVNLKTIGDINDDGFNDIVFASNSGQFWGVMYNDGTGSFSNPEYHYVNGYYPSAIACKDLNDDNRDDIVVCGQSTEVYFSYPEGFQPMVLETGDFKDGVSIVDFNLDGENDILTFVDYPIGSVTGLVMYQNQGNNILDTLDQLYFPFSSSNYFVTDFDNDSLMDILFQLGDYSGYVIYYNQGNFQLADSQFVALPPSDPEEAWRNCYCADMDGNGYNDIITVKTLNAYLPDNLEILFNDGHGHFGEDPVAIIESPYSRLKTPNLFFYPNPAKSHFTLQSQLLEQDDCKLEVYNLAMGKVKTLKIKKGKATVEINTQNWTKGIYLIMIERRGKIEAAEKLIIN